MENFNNGKFNKFNLSDAKNIKNLQQKFNVKNDTLQQNLMLKKN